MTLDQQTGIKMMTQDLKNGAPGPPKCQPNGAASHQASQLPAVKQGWEANLLCFPAPPKFTNSRLGCQNNHSGKPESKPADVRGPAAEGEALKIKLIYRHKK